MILFRFPWMSPCNFYHFSNGTFPCLSVCCFDEDWSVTKYTYLWFNQVFCGVHDWFMLLFLLPMLKSPLQFRIHYPNTWCIIIVAAAASVVIIRNLITRVSKKALAGLWQSSCLCRTVNGTGVHKEVCFIWNKSLQLHENVIKWNTNFP